MGSHRVRHDRSDLAAIASKVILKILQARLQQYVNHELPDVQMVLEKAEEQKLLLLLLSRFSCVRLCVTPQTAAH